MRFDYDALPFVPEALPLARECIVPGGSYANQAYLEPMTAFGAKQGDDILFYDAQTSGGLLMAKRMHLDSVSSSSKRDIAIQRLLEKCCRCKTRHSS